MTKNVESQNSRKQDRKSCPMCEKSFTQWHAVSTHLRKAHGGYTPPPLDTQVEVSVDGNGGVLLRGKTYRILGGLKSPFTSSGYGLLGAMVSTLDGKNVVCHECGREFGSLACHVTRVHKMRVVDYKEKYGLLKGTSLDSPFSSEIKREVAITQRSRSWKKVLSVNRDTILKKHLDLKKHKGSDAWKKRYPGCGGNGRAEFLNKRGQCVPQLRDRLVFLAKKYGEKPALLKKGNRRYPRRDVDTLANLLLRRYGSWGKGKRVLLMESAPDRVKSDRERWSRKMILETVVRWAKENKRYPYSSDFRNGIKLGLPLHTVITNYFGSINNMRIALGWPIVIPGWSRPLPAPVVAVATGLS